MKNVVFDCEVITPMFLAGADGRTPELRPPSIKGMLRFWWRAMQGFDTIEEMHKAEGEIFGGTEESMGRSKFSLRVRGNDSLQTTKYSALPHKNKKQAQFPAIQPGYSFKIITDADEKIQKLIEAASFLGGLGKRSRRGVGAFQIRRKDFKLEALAEQLNIIGGAELFVVSSNEIKRGKMPSKKYSYIEKIQLGRCFENYDDLLKAVGDTSHNNNSKYTGWAIGLRLGSPIIVSVIKQDIRYVPIITTLKTVFPSNPPREKNTQSDFIEELI